MIEVGDLVRYKNKYLRARFGSPGSLMPGKKKKKSGLIAGILFQRRGKQRLSRVIALSEPEWNWQNRSWNQVATLDNGQVVSVHWLALVRKGTEKNRLEFLFNLSD